MATPEAPRGGGRLAALDTLRGLVMVVMALDHANAFGARSHSTGEWWAACRSAPSQISDADPY